MMFYRVSDVKRKKDRIYNVKKINYISRNKNKIRIHYNIWTDVLKSETEEEAIDFMDNIHKQLNKKEYSEDYWISYYRKIYTKIKRRF